MEVAILKYLINYTPLFHQAPYFTYCQYSHVERLSERKKTRTKELLNEFHIELLGQWKR